MMSPRGLLRLVRLVFLFVSVVGLTVAIGGLALGVGVAFWGGLATFLVGVFIEASLDYKRMGRGSR